MMLQRSAIWVLLIFLVTASAFAQQTQGVVIISTAIDKQGRTESTTFTATNEKAKDSGISDSIMTETYFRLDTIALVYPNDRSGMILGRDSAMALFWPEHADSVRHIAPSTQSKIISGFHCTCTDVFFTSGRRAEFWITSEVDSNICRFFARSSWNKLWMNDGTYGFIKDLNEHNKIFICRRSFDAFGQFDEQSTIEKIAMTMISGDELNIPSSYKIIPTTPEIMKKARK